MPAAQQTASQFNPRRAWYALSILILLYCMSFLDRLIISLLAPSISEHLEVSDTQIGVLFGLGFGVVYALTGLPLAHLVDRRHRVSLVAAGVALWSICTVASGFAPNYTWLIILRAGVAVGEAVLSPAAISIIGDIFPREKRTLPTTAYTAVSTFMGSGSFIIGGLALQWATNLSDSFGLEPWQLTLVFVGLPGLLLAPLFLFTVPEPPRTGDVKNQRYSTAADAIAYLKKERWLYGCIFVAAALMTTIGFAKTAWVPTLLIRGHGMSASEAGYAYGTVGLIAGLIGAALWPTLVKAWMSRGRRSALVTIFLFGLTSNWVLLAVVGLTRSSTVLLTAAGLANFFGTAAAVLIPLLVQLVTPGRMRGRIMAVYLMANNLVGMALGPPLAAFLGDRLFEGPFAIGSGLAVMVFVAGPIASIAVWLMHKPFRRALDEAEALEAAAAASPPEPEPNKPATAPVGGAEGALGGGKAG